VLFEFRSVFLVPLCRHTNLPFYSNGHPPTKIMEATIQETGKAFTIFYDTFRDVGVIVQEGVEFEDSPPPGDLCSLEPS